MPLRQPAKRQAPQGSARELRRVTSSERDGPSQEKTRAQEVDHAQEFAAQYDPEISGYSRRTEELQSMLANALSAPVATLGGGHCW